MTNLLDIQRDIDRMQEVNGRISVYLQELRAVRQHLQYVSDALDSGKLPGFWMRLTPHLNNSWDNGIAHHNTISPAENVESKNKFIQAYRDLLLSQVEHLYQKIQDEREML